MTGRAIRDLLIQCLNCRNRVECRENSWVVILVDSGRCKNLAEIVSTEKEVVALENLHYTFVKTCSACPEQYDVYHNGALVGYVRLRHGSLTAHATGGSLVYDYDFPDRQQGAFDSKEQRKHHFERISEAFAKREGKRDDAND